MAKHDITDGSLTKSTDASIRNVASNGPLSSTDISRVNASSIADQLYDPNSDDSDNLALLLSKNETLKASKNLDKANKVGLTNQAPIVKNPKTNKRVKPKKKSSLILNEKRSSLVHGSKNGVCSLNPGSASVGSKLKSSNSDNSSVSNGCSTLRRSHRLNSGMNSWFVCCGLIYWNFDRSPWNGDRFKYFFDA